MTGQSKTDNNINIDNSINNKEAVGTIAQTIKSSEFTKIDHTRS